MTQDSRPASPSRQPSHAVGSFRVAIVGAATLKGKELAEVLSDRNFPRRDVKLLDDDESLGQLEAVGDEMSFVQAIRPEHFENVDFAFFASEESFTRRHWEMARQAGCAIVDLSFGLENIPGAVLRSPWVERQLGRAPSPDLEPAPVVVAHPASVVLALLLLRTQKAGRVNSVTVTLYEPASEQGRRGMDELHEQTVNLLSFHELPRQVFDTQVAFNLVSRYGQKAHLPLEGAERRVLSHYQRLTAGQALLPALMLVQAPIFHGHAFSIYFEMAEMVSVGDMSQVLAGEHVLVSRGAEESPSTVSAAGQGDILLTCRHDASHQNGIWVWAAADNLRIVAGAAVEIAEEIATARPRGKIQ
jgi:aspartate-semialdehyde dehydrogenase